MLVMLHKLVRFLFLLVVFAIAGAVGYGLIQDWRHRQVLSPAAPCTVGPHR